MNTNITKTWTIKIDRANVMARCTNETLYQAYNRLDANPKGDAIVINDDDKQVFDMYFAAAIAELQMLLARRMDTAPVVDGEVTTFTLQMHDNHDDNVLPILVNHCYEFLVKDILERWYKAELGAALEKLEINHCIHYRKNPVRRRIGPLF